MSCEEIGYLYECKIYATPFAAFITNIVPSGKGTFSQVYSHIECMSWYAGIDDAGIYHFENTTNLVLGNGTCTGAVICSDGSWVEPWGTPLHCWINCKGYLNCFGSSYNGSVWQTWPGETYGGCIMHIALSDPLYDPLWLTEVKVIPV